MGIPNSHYLVCPKCKRYTNRIFRETEDGFGVCNKNGCDARLVPRALVKGNKKLEKAREEYEKINSTCNSNNCSIN
jgi:hypothetical protein